MAVVAAGVHRAGAPGAVVLRSLFVDAQGVHVGAERDGPIAAAAFERADDAGAAHALGDVVEAELPQLGSDEGACALLLESELGMRVQVTPPIGHLPLEGAEIHGHGVLLYRAARRVTTSSRTLAPATRSCSGVCSRGLWLMPPMLGTNIIADGAILAII